MIASRPLRTMFGVIALILLGRCLAVSAQTASATTPIFTATDIHYFAPELYDRGAAFTGMLMSSDGKDTAHGDAILGAFAYELPNPSILIVTGDLTLNGEAASHRALARRFEDLRKRGVEVFVLPGNHDLDNPWACSYSGSGSKRVSSVSAEEFARRYQDCGFSKASSRDGRSLSYYAPIGEGLGLLMLDSTRHDANYQQGYPEAGGGFSPETLRWIDETLATAHRGGRRMIVAMHHSLIDHNAMLGGTYTLDDSDKLIPILIKNGQGFILDGHIHIQSVAKYSSDEGSIFDIATGSLSVYPHNYGRLDYPGPDGRLEYATKRLDVAAWARGAGKPDTYLLGYDENSRLFFGGFARRLVDKFGLTDGLTKDELDFLDDFMADLNCDCFAGVIDEGLKKKYLASRGYAAVLKLKGSFLPEYISSILDISGLDNNRIIIDPQK